MKREWIIFVCGMVVLFLPILGFPRVFDNFLLIVAGLLLCALSLRELRRGYVKELYEKDQNPG